MVSVDLGESQVKIPVFDKAGDSQGKTLLVTAGMDGDEYASIDAAYRMIEELQTASFYGRIIIVPIVNTPGFEKEVSYNPLDGKYPKLVGIGKKDGSASERLIHWLVDSYAIHADMWLDLHGGNVTEKIAPFLWAWQTRMKLVDVFIQSFCESYSPSFAIFESYFMYGKAAHLATRGCGYIYAESGGSSERLDIDIEQHCLWVRNAIATLGMTSSDNTIFIKVSLYKKYRQYTSKIQGMWFPEATKIRYIKKGELLGMVHSFDLSREEKIVAKEDAQVLWIKEGMKSSNKEILIAVAYSQW